MPEVNRGPYIFIGTKAESAAHYFDTVMSYNKYKNKDDIDNLAKDAAHKFGSSLKYSSWYIASFNEVAHTNIEAVFDLILNAAVNNHLPQSELPSKLYIISDMEFDSCVNNAKLTNFENAARKYAQAGYKLPQLIFWNVASRRQQQPVTVNDRGVALVSGCSPRIFSMAMQGELDPWTFMLSVLNTERYAPIAA